MGCGDRAASVGGGILAAAAVVGTGMVENNRRLMALVVCGRLGVVVASHEALAEAEWEGVEVSGSVLELESGACVVWLSFLLHDSQQSL